MTLDGKRQLDGSGRVILDASGRLMQCCCVPADEQIIYRWTRCVHDASGPPSGSFLSTLGAPNMFSEYVGNKCSNVDSGVVVTPRVVALVIDGVPQGCFTVDYEGCGSEVSGFVYTDTADWEIFGRASCDACECDSCGPCCFGDRMYGSAFYRVTDVYRSIETDQILVRKRHVVEGSGFRTRPQSDNIISVGGVNYLTGVMKVTDTIEYNYPGAPDDVESVKYFAASIMKWCQYTVTRYTFGFGFTPAKLDVKYQWNWGGTEASSEAAAQAIVDSGGGGGDAIFIGGAGPIQNSYLNFGTYTGEGDPPDDCGGVVRGSTMTFNGTGDFPIPEPVTVKRTEYLKVSVGGNDCCGDTEGGCDHCEGEDGTSDVSGYLSSLDDLSYSSSGEESESGEGGSESGDSGGGESGGSGDSGGGGGSGGGGSGEESSDDSGGESSGDSGQGTSGGDFGPPNPPCVFQDFGECCDQYLITIVSNNSQLDGQYLLESLPGGGYGVAESNGVVITMDCADTGLAGNNSAIVITAQTLNGETFQWMVGMGPDGCPYLGPANLITPPIGGDAPYLILNTAPGGCHGSSGPGCNTSSGALEGCVWMKVVHLNCDSNITSETPWILVSAILDDLGICVDDLDDWTPVDDSEDGCTYVMYALGECDPGVPPAGPVILGEGGIDTGNCECISPSSSGDGSDDSEGGGSGSGGSGGSDESESDSSSGVFTGGCTMIDDPELTDVPFTISLASSGSCDTIVGSGVLLAGADGAFGGRARWYYDQPSPVEEGEFPFKVRVTCRADSEGDGTHYSVVVTHPTGGYITAIVDIPRTLANQKNPTGTHALPGYAPYCSDTGYLITFS